MAANGRLKLLPKDDLLRTSGVDHADWNYSPLLSIVMRRRFALIERLLPAARVHRLLEIGYGSGVFMPQLAEHCDELYGIDVHPFAEEVQMRLERHGVRAVLAQQDAARTQFPDGFFDAIVCVSALEFIADIEGAAREIARVLSPAGVLIAVMPGRSRFLDLMLYAFTRQSAHSDYGERRERVLPAMLGHFTISDSRTFAPVYTAYAFAPRQFVPG